MNNHFKFAPCPFRAFNSGDWAWEIVDTIGGWECNVDRRIILSTADQTARVETLPDSIASPNRPVVLINPPIGPNERIAIRFRTDYEPTEYVNAIAFALLEVPEANEKLLGS